MLSKLIILLVVASLWASAFIFIKMEEQTIQPITIMAGRAFIAFLGLLGVALITKKKIFGYIRDTWKFVIFSVLGITLLWLAVAFGQEDVSPGVTAVLVAINPLITFIILVFILREFRFSVKGFSGLLIGICGIILVVGISKVIHGGAKLDGASLILLGNVGLAINGILASKWAHDIHPVIVSVWFLFFAALSLGVLAFIYEHPLQSPWTKDNYIFEITLGLVCTGGGYYGYYYLIHKAGPYIASFIFYFIPVFGLIFGFLILGEKVLLSQIVGVAAIIGGVYVVKKAIAKGES